MSLIPYAPAESREIVLRHGSAVVVYDQRSKQLSLRDASHSTAVQDTSCPYCRRPYRDPSPHPDDNSDREHTPRTPGRPDAENGFVNPAYFQMLRTSQPGSTNVSRPSSPHKQLAPAPISDAQGRLHSSDAAEFVGSTPVPPRNISAKAFSPDYFKTFFVEERELGRGGKGVVLLVQHLLDGVQLGRFACKRVPVGDDHEWLEKVLIEVQLLQNLSHENLVSYRHVWLEDFQISNFGPSVPCAFILQQYCNAGDLHDYILDSARTTITKEQMKERLRRRSKGQLEEPDDMHGPRRMHFDEIISFFKDITSGLNHLHANGYIHRDLKPSNCLLHNTGQKIRVLVSDFGEVQSANVARNSTGATGTISYCAPEVLRQERPGGAFGNFTTKSDIFSLGMIVYFMCFARLPYRNADGINEDEEDLDQLRAEISTWAGMDDEHRVRSDLPEKLYRSLKRLLALRPEDRPGTEEILQVLKSPILFDEFNAYGGSSDLDDFSPRISRADTPSPSPASSSHRVRTPVHYTRPGRSNLSASVMDRSPSPPALQPMPRKSSEDGAVMLRNKKLEFPVPQLMPRTPSPRRLMLPPPPRPPTSRISQWFTALENPVFVGTAKVLFFCIKAFSLLSPCQPFVADTRLVYPLLAFASLDFIFLGFGGVFVGRQVYLNSLCASALVLAMHLVISSPPTSAGKAHTLRELSRSLSHSPRDIPSPSPPPSDSNPTQRSGFAEDTSSFWKDADIIHSTQHKIEDETNTLPQYPRIRSTAKKINAWQMPRSAQPGPDTSVVNKEFGDFDHSISDEDDAMSVEQARGVGRSARNTPSKLSAQFNSLYDVTPPSSRTPKPYAAETGSLRRDAQIRRASRNDLDTASPRPASKRNSPALPSKQDRSRTSLAQLHAKLSEDESSFMDHRPPTLTMDSAKNTRWGNRSRHTSLQVDGTVDATARNNPARPATTQNATAQSFILPDLPNLTELVSGVFEDGTPVFSKNLPARSRFSAPSNGGRKPQQHTPIEGVPIPDEEKAIFAALQLLQDKVADMERERAEADKRIEEQDLELIELRATTQAQEKLRRNDSGQDSDSGKGSWKVEKTRLDATVQTLRTKLDRAERKTAVLEIEKKRLNTERDNMAAQLGVAFQTCEELKREKTALSSENDALREEIDALRAENEALRDQLDQELSQHREETTKLRRQFDQTANATEKENATLHAELARVRAQQDDHTQQLARKDMELRKARQEQAEFDRLKNDHESLKAQLTDLKARRDEDVKRWSRQEAALKSQVDRRDETIRHFQDMTQEQTNEAMRLDNENLRQELAQLSAQYEADNAQWAQKEMAMKKKIKQREEAARNTLDHMTREVLSIREANSQRHENPYAAVRGKDRMQEDTLQPKPSYRREDTRTRIKNRVEEEVRNSKAASTSQMANSVEESSPRKTYTGVSRFPQRASAPVDQHRSFSAPVRADKNAYLTSDVESTTDLSLAPRSTPYTSRSAAPVKSATTVQPPADLDLTELSYIDSAQIAQLRRALEEERAAARKRAQMTSSEQDPPREETVRSQRQTREDTIRSQRQTREDTVRSVTSQKSERRPSLPRKSSLKDVTQRTNVTQFEEDVTGDMSNLDADAEATQMRQQPVVDASMLSNTGRRRRSAHTEMTSAFIMPDLKLDNRKQTTTTTTIRISHGATSKDHDNSNCTVCRREGLTSATEDLRVPKLVAVSSRMPDDADATMRPARSPRQALALVVKELKDERAHLHMELAVMRAMLESHDVSLGNRRRQEINASIQDLLRRLEIKDTQIYNLFDVLEGQQTDDLTELDVENITEQIRAEGDKTQAEPEKKTKKVTIRSFVDDDSVEAGRGVTVNMDGETEELPWEGFEDTGMEGDMSYGAFAGWKKGAH
ncbi:hypothetical protein ACEQ8H_008071 [Pleosporales sp. CAS-2024a]